MYILGHEVVPVTFKPLFLLLHLRKQNKNLNLFESESCSAVSDSPQPHGLYSPWNSSGQNTGVGSLSLLQGIFPTQESNQGLLHCRWILYKLSYEGSPYYKTILSSASDCHTPHAFPSPLMSTEEQESLIQCPTLSVPQDHPSFLLHLSRNHPDQFHSPNLLEDHNCGPLTLRSPHLVFLVHFL